jgi:hypothetical protein
VRVREAVVVLVGVLVLVNVVVGEGLMVGVGVKVGVAVGTVGVRVGVISSGINVQVGAFVREGESCIVGRAVQVTDGVMEAAALVLPAAAGVARGTTGSKPANPPPGIKFPNIRTATKPTAPTAASPSTNNMANCVSVIPNKRPWVRLVILVMETVPLTALASLNFCVLFHLPLFSNLSKKIRCFFLVCRQVGGLLFPAGLFCGLAPGGRNEIKPHQEDAKNGPRHQ